MGGTHADQRVSWQSTGHGSVAHDHIELRWGHAFPPAPGWRSTVRVPIFHPFPHVFEHAVQFASAVTTQSCGGHAGGWG